MDHFDQSLQTANNDLTTITAITKEQFCRICHISKHYAKYLLDSGLVKCVDSGKNTRKYTIQAKDVWAYLIDQDAYPEKYKALAEYYAAHSGKSKRRFSSSQLSETAEPIPFMGQEKSLLYTLWEWEAACYADLMTTADVCNLNGYQSKTVYNWYHSHLVIGFMICRKLLIPKSSLLEYLMQSSANLQSIGRCFGSMGIRFQVALRICNLVKSKFKRISPSFFGFST